MANVRWITISLLFVWVTTVVCLPIPQENTDETEQKQQEQFDAAIPAWRARGLKPTVEQKSAYIKKLEADIAQAAVANVAAQAAKMEQELEDEILETAVRTLYKDRNDKDKLEADKRAIEELVERDKRAVDLLSGVLGGSGGGGGTGDGEENSGGGSNLLSLVSGIFSGSSGGGGGSVSIGGPAVPDVSLKGATYDDLIAQSRQNFNPISILSNSVSQAIQTKFTVFRSVLSLVGNLFTSKQANFGALKSFGGAFGGGAHAGGTASGGSSNQYLPPAK